MKDLLKRRDALAQEQLSRERSRREEALQELHEERKFETMRESAAREAEYKKSALRPASEEGSLKIQVVRLMNSGFREVTRMNGSGGIVDGGIGRSAI